ncbi:hypothetical protein ABFT38_002481 [Salmonella enterica]|nr:hypothetical protein [Salmonella enterica]EHJ9402000.1 hypothetical protein [Salmonella enterica]
MGFGFGGGGGSSSTTTTSTTTSWLSSLLEPIVTDFINSGEGINYENSVIADLTPAEQAALDAYGSGAAINTGKQIAGAGAGLVKTSISDIQALLGGGAADQFKTGVTDIYNGMSGFMEGQNAAIESDVYSEMGQAFGSSAQSNMASTSVSGSSAAQNAQNSIMASGANEMIQRESELSGKVLSGAVGLTGNAISGEIGLIDQLMKEGHSIFGTGANMAATGQSNQFKAGLFEQYYNQETADNNRKNDMINNNMDWLNMAALLDVVLPTAGIDTTTTGTSKSKSHKSGFSI